MPGKKGKEARMDRIIFCNFKGIKRERKKMVDPRDRRRTSLTEKILRGRAWYDNPIKNNCDKNGCGPLVLPAKKFFENIIDGEK
jgi:hypothetical protein